MSTVEAIGMDPHAPASANAVPVKRLAVAPVGPGLDANPHVPAAIIAADEPLPVPASASGHSAASLDEAFPALAQAIAFPWDKNGDGWVDDQIALGARERQLRAADEAEARTRESARREAARRAEPDAGPVTVRQQASYATATGPRTSRPAADPAQAQAPAEPDPAPTGHGHERYAAPATTAAAAAVTPASRYL
jgi:hypothetical protein